MFFLSLRLYAACASGSFCKDYDACEPNHINKTVVTASLHALAASISVRVFNTVCPLPSVRVKFFSKDEIFEQPAPTLTNLVSSLALLLGVCFSGHAGEVEDGRNEY